MSLACGPVPYERVVKAVSEGVRVDSFAGPDHEAASAAHEKEKKA